jgi:hypothetical protein
MSNFRVQIIYRPDNFDGNRIGVKAAVIPGLLLFAGEVGCGVQVHRAQGLFRRQRRIRCFQLALLALGYHFASFFPGGFEASHDPLFFQFLNAFDRVKPPVNVQEITDLDFGFARSGRSDVRQFLRNVQGDRGQQTISDRIAGRDA